MDTLLWQEEVFLCAVPSSAGGCAGGEACVPADTGEYSGLCVEKDGDEACPDGWTDEDIQVYTAATDQRACSSCACLTGASCGSDGKYTVYDNTTCGGSKKTVDSTACVNVYNQLAIEGSLLPTLASVQDGQCGGGQPTGQLDLAGAKKICCKN